MSCLKKFISAKLDQVAQEILLLLVNNLPEKHITKVQTDEILSALFVICVRVTRKMHSFSTNQTRLIFLCMLLQALSDTENVPHFLVCWKAMAL